MDTKRILIIEDDQILLKNIKEILEEEGYIVRTESDGQNGLKTAFDWIPDLIICDISIPYKNGYEVLGELVNSDKVKAVPFIFLTAKVEKEDIRKGMQLGADDYIFKPFDLNDLLNSIKMRIEKVKHRLTVSNENKTYQMADKLMIKIGSNMHFCEVKDLKYLKARNPYVLLKFDNGKNSMQRQTLDQWELQLPTRHFLRIHRSTIINVEFINKIQKSGASYIIHLKGEEEPFMVSKRYGSKIKENLS